MFEARDLHLLVTFASVVRHGSFTTAAQELGQSKSLVSENIRCLEERCGVQLIERTTRRMRLTQVGEQVLSTATQIVNATRGLDALLEEHRSSPVGTLRVATTHDLGSLLVAPLCAKLALLHPQLGIDIVTDDVSHDLIANRVDLAVRLGQPKESGNVVKPLALVSEPIVAAPPLASQWSHVVRPRDLEGAPWARHSLVSRSDTLTFLGPKGEKEDVKLQLRAQCNTGEGVRALLLQGIGIGVLPEYLIADDLQRGTLLRLCPGWIWKQVQLYVELAQAKRKPRRVQLFLQALSDALTPNRTDGTIPLWQRLRRPG